MQWQSIETAPKDGTEIIIFVPAWTRKVHIGAYDVDVRLLNGKEINRSEGWAITGPGVGWHDPEPTHWMPLPGGPK